MRGPFYPVSLGLDEAPCADKESGSQAAIASMYAAAVQNEQKNLAELVLLGVDRTLPCGGSSTRPKVEIRFKGELATLCQWESALDELLQKDWSSLQPRLPVLLLLNPASGQAAAKRLFDQVVAPMLDQAHVPYQVKGSALLSCVSVSY